MTSIPIGARFGHLTVIGADLHLYTPHRRRVVVQCVCKAKFTARESRLLSGETRSCGCGGKRKSIYRLTNRRGRQVVNKIIWTDDMVKTLREVHAKGNSATVAGQFMGISTPTVSAKLKELGLVAAYHRPKEAGLSPVRFPKFTDIAKPNCDKYGPKPSRDHDFSLTGNSSAMLVSP